MRKTLIAMLGLAALVVWALPAFASDAGLPQAERYTPLDRRAGAIGALANHGNYTATLSGTVVKQASATTTWFLYPNACQQRALGTWAPATAVQADSLDTYTTGGLGSYDVLDQSLKEILWHKVDTGVPASQRGPILAGTASLWCGKFDPNYKPSGASGVTAGYPNLTRQLLYVDVGTQSTNYTLTFAMNQSSEYNYDYVRLIGGGGGLTDPIGNDAPSLDDLVATGVHNTEKVLVVWTGTIRSDTPGATSISAVTPPVGGVPITGSGTGNPNVTSLPVSVTIAAGNRALYWLFISDCLYSNGDGLWPFGNGDILDNISTTLGSNNAAIFVDGTAPIGSDPVGAAGQVIQGSFGTQGFISGRVTPGTGTLWQIVDGNFAGTSDNCQAQKNDVADKMFFGVDAGTKKTIPNQFNSVVACTLPIQPGTASIIAAWGEYLDLPGGSGYVQYSEYRFFKNGTWSNWGNTRGQDVVVTSVINTWAVGANELAQATQADSVQIRYNLECIANPAFAVNGVCQQVDYGIMYDDLYMQVLTGVPAPVFSEFPGNAPQTTFVDGTMTGLYCDGAHIPCWVGPRGSLAPESPGNSNIDIHDNVNCALGDSLTVVLLTGLRKDGMGINWKQGYDKAINEGLTISHTNNTYNAAFDQPRVIYRLFDPTSHTWSQFDSTVLDANYITARAGIDTVLLKSEFRWNWPPRDKAGLNLPAGFTINGVGAYSSLAFLPRGTRLQYYFKAVDINGGTSYQFSTDNLAREVADLPTLPGGSVVAPDINEFDVLPGAYAPGTAGTLLAGQTATPILNLDANYGGWDYAQDPVTVALRGLGVRADRYRRQGALGEGNGVGGHELVQAPDLQRQERLSNHFPNRNEYGVVESLAVWYRIMIQSTHDATATLDDESDARVMSEWWSAETGGTGALNKGDRCMLGTGDDYFNQLLNAQAGDPSPRRKALGQNVFGVNSANSAWTGSGNVSFLYPSVEDRFANPASGPTLVAGYTYPVDGGCPTPNRFDALSKIGSSDAQNAAFYPIVAGQTDVAGVAMMTEADPGADADNDRNKALCYGYSIQFVRKAGIPTSAANYVRSGLTERMQILYKFLTSCRGQRSGAAADTAKCWPCPTDANMTGNWNALSGFQTGAYGPLYPIQDNTAATGVEVSDASGAPRVNRLDGNFPNPFNPQTTIRYSSAQTGKVTIRIFNVGGQLVRSLSTKAEVGPNEVRWNGRRDDGTPLASGVYFYRVKFADGSESASRMALVK